MERKLTDPPGLQPAQQVVAPATSPARRRSKMACDTCHYRKIKCNVERCFPCKNCEKNAVQCTMVGPSMRPPRSISGSSSAAAAAAVAVAMATVANARLPCATFATGYDGFPDSSRTVSPRSTHKDERARLPARVEDYQQQLNLFHPLMRRSSASSVQALDNGTDASDSPRHRRKLQSYYSSPSSLRNLFISSGGGSSGGGGPVRSAGSSLSGSYRHPETPPALNRFSSANAYGGREPSTAETKVAGGYDYFNLPISQSAGSTPSVSSPSCNIILRGMAQLNPFDDSRLPSTTAPGLSVSLSLPPTPTHPIFDRLSDGISSPTSPFDLAPASAPLRPQSLQSPHRLVGHIMKPMPRRTTSSSYLVSQHQAMDGPAHHFPDRRSSLPWNAHISSSSQPPCEPRILGISQQRVEMVSHTTGPGTATVAAATVSGLNHAVQTKDKDQDMAVAPAPMTPPQGYLLRSNSTPAIFGPSSIRLMNYAVHHKPGNEGLSHPSSRPLEVNGDTASRVETSAYKPLQDSSLPDLRSHRPGHPFDVFDDNNEGSLTHVLPPTQAGWPSQCSPQGDSPCGDAGATSNAVQSSEAAQRHLADITRGTNNNYGGNLHEYSGNIQGSIPRQLKETTTVYDNNVVMATISNSLYIDASHSQDPGRSRHGCIKDQVSGDYEGWNQSSFMSVDRSWNPKDQQYGSQTTLREERVHSIQLPSALGRGNGFHPDQMSSGSKAMTVHSQLSRPTVDAVMPLSGLGSAKDKHDVPQHPLQQNQYMKAEVMDSENLESSLAMVLDGHLSLMDLHMRSEVYSEGLPLASMTSFKQHVPSMPIDLRANPVTKPMLSDTSSSTSSGLDGGSVSMAPSTIYTVISGPTTTNSSNCSENSASNICNNNGCGGGCGANNNGSRFSSTGNSTYNSTSSTNITTSSTTTTSTTSTSANGDIIVSNSDFKQEANSDPISYFDTPEGTSFQYSGGGEGGNLLQIKAEPDLRQHPLSNPLHYTLERQHPLDSYPLPQLPYQHPQHHPQYHQNHYHHNHHHHQQQHQQHQQHQQQQQSRGLHQQCSLPLTHGTPVLVAEYSGKPLHYQ
ncbi:hypothetical protein B0O80DRAFT_159513 [Mortierella sp. GBAus27b]|nr:hypothetical protein B0O80DRAFT_159513 [Mortierella sp. GBAus27b]